MINILPDNVRRENKRAYFFRYATYASFFAGLLIFLFVIAIVPAHLALVGEIAYQEALLPKADEVSNKINKSDAEQVALELRILDQKSEKSILGPKDALALVLDKRGKVRLLEFGYRAQGGVLNLRGIAPDRSSLVLFSQALQTDRAVSAVTLPVGALLPERDIAFTMVVTLRSL